MPMNTLPPTREGGGGGGGGGLSEERRRMAEECKAQSLTAHGRAERAEETEGRSPSLPRARSASGARCPDSRDPPPSMGGGRKRRRRDGSEAPAIHPRNRYAAAAPDFAMLAARYPSFRPFVSFSRGRASIDFTDFAATRELTRVLLLHDHGVNWWIPDGQLCPTVPNRSNYIHWIEDLLSSDLIPPISSSSETVRGFDIGTGANCIYPLLGASLRGWNFVGSDVADVALEWAKKNVESNPHLAYLIEIRNANELPCSSKVETVTGEAVRENALEPVDDVVRSKPPILVGVVKDSESFDFCMCNPPFFESIEEAGLNPKTSCGGMVVTVLPRRLNPKTSCGGMVVTVLPRRRLGIVAVRRGRCGGSPRLGHLGGCPGKLGVRGVAAASTMISWAGALATCACRISEGCEWARETSGMT